MSRRVSLGLALLLTSSLSVASAPEARTESRSASSPTVIAIVEPGGMNVLHRDFRRLKGQVMGRLPKARTVRLPTRGSFEQRLDEVQRGPLGDTDPGVLYRIAGTRIAGVYSTQRLNLLDRRDHGTGVASAAVGLEHGTSSDSILVFLPDPSFETWEWLADQDWIDIVSTSYFAIYFSPNQICGVRPYIQQIIEQGRLVFSAAGNTEQIGAVSTPSGAPEAYQVGGVDDEGRPFIPSSEAVGTPTRPYETGDRFSFLAASWEDERGSMQFGGTSGAAPSTAGRAAELIAFARRTLGSTYSGARRGRLATAGKGVRPPRQGPLADGDLTAEELIDVLHGSAIPFLPTPGARYLAEGYGALTDEAVSFGKKVLAGKAELPERPEDDQAHEGIEALRRAHFDTRC